MSTLISCKGEVKEGNQKTTYQPWADIVWACIQELYDPHPVREKKIKMQCCWFTDVTIRIVLTLTVAYVSS